VCGPLQLLQLLQLRRQHCRPPGAAHAFLTSSAAALSRSADAMQVPPNLCTCQWAPRWQPSTAGWGASASTLRTVQVALREALLPMGLQLLRSGAWPSRAGVTLICLLLLPTGRCCCTPLLLLLL
jgi:hypothetical protein